MMGEVAACLLFLDAAVETMHSRHVMPWTDGLVRAVQRGHFCIAQPGRLRIEAPS